MSCCCDMTEIMFKAAENTIQSINRSHTGTPPTLSALYTSVTSLCKGSLSGSAMQTTWLISKLFIVEAQELHNLTNQLKLQL